MKKEVRNLLIALMVFMLMATVLLKIVDYQADGRVSTLSLREVVPPSDDVLFMVEGSTYARYLRSSVGIHYDGKDWNLPKIAEVYQYLDRGSNLNNVYSPDDAHLSRSYRDYNRDVLNDLGVLDSTDCLQLPDNITDRVRDLSYRITSGMPTPFEKAKAIEEFLQVRCDYRMDYEPAPPGHEPNDWFLCETREGICGNFNSAFVILARASGIPARLSAGYYLLPGNGAPQPVYPSQAHAWAEVGFEGLGWLAFEAVPP